MTHFNIDLNELYSNLTASYHTQKKIPAGPVKKFDRISDLFQDKNLEPLRTHFLSARYCIEAGGNPKNAIFRELSSLQAKIPDPNLFHDVALAFIIAIGKNVNSLLDQAHRIFYQFPAPTAQKNPFFESNKSLYRACDTYGKDFMMTVYQALNTHIHKYLIPELLHMITDAKEKFRNMNIANNVTLTFDLFYYIAVLFFIGINVRFNS